MIYVKDNVFLLDGKNYSYAMRVTKSGYLQHLHFGGKVKIEDLPRLCAMGEPHAPQPGDLNKDFFLDLMPSEYGTYARGDFRDPTGIFERGDGASMSRLTYKSYKTIKGAPQLEGLPHVRTADDTLVITLKDDFSNTEIDLYYIVCEDSDVITRYAVIRNTGKDAVMLKKAFSFRLDLPRGEYKCLQLGGTWSQECTPRITDFARGITRIQSLRGCNFHRINQFMGVMRPDCGETHGVCYGFQLIYSGSFALTGEWDAVAPLSVQGGISDVEFGWELKSGEEFTTPQVAICYSDCGLGEMSREYHDFLRKHLINPDFVYKQRPVLVNNWEATYFDFDDEILCAIVDQAAKIGLDTFVLDDGWFGKRNSESGLGDWTVNTNKLKGGLKTVIDRCKKYGMKFGLWFEPEMINEDSDLYRAHPDWIVHKPNAEPVFLHGQLVLDFTRKDVVDYIFDAVSKILSENDISYVKWDMNRPITESYSTSLPSHRQGEFMHRFILGVYDFTERLMRRFPNVFFEGCSSGGGRFDAGMLYYFPQIWTSDCTDAFERIKIQYGTSMCYPPSAMSCHVSACPNHQTGRSTSFSTRGAIASLGAFGYELDLTKMSEEELDQAKKQVEEYRKTAELVLHGDLYRLYSPFDSNYFCEMIVDKDKSRAYLVGMRIQSYPRSWDLNNYLYIDGLDEKKMYRIEELGTVASGAALKHAGVYAPKLGDFEAWVWHITEVQ